jgi:hypothetical protein
MKFIVWVVTIAHEIYFNPRLSNPNETCNSQNSYFNQGNKLHLPLIPIKDFETQVHVMSCTPNESHINTLHLNFLQLTKSQKWGRQGRNYTCRSSPVNTGWCLNISDLCGSWIHAERRPQEMSVTDALFQPATWNLTSCGVTKQPYKVLMKYFSC